MNYVFCLSTAEMDSELVTKDLRLESGSTHLVVGPSARGLIQLHGFKQSKVPKKAEGKQLFNHVLFINAMSIFFHAGRTYTCSAACVAAQERNLSCWA